MHCTGSIYYRHTHCYPEKHGYVCFNVHKVWHWGCVTWNMWSASPDTLQDSLASHLFLFCVSNIYIPECISLRQTFIGIIQIIIDIRKVFSVLVWEVLLKMFTNSCLSCGPLSSGWWESISAEYHVDQWFSLEMFNSVFLFYKDLNWLTITDNASESDVKWSFSFNTKPRSHPVILNVDMKCGD